MQNKDVITGKGNSVELESLHGAITQVYVNGVINILNGIHADELRSSQYQEELEESDTPEEVIEPYRMGLSKDDLALLKQAQSFLKENDVQMDVIGKTSSRKVRSKLLEQLKDKRNLLEND